MRTDTWPLFITDLQTPLAGIHYWTGWLQGAGGWGFSAPMKDDVCIHPFYPVSCPLSIYILFCSSATTCYMIHVQPVSWMHNNPFQSCDWNHPPRFDKLLVLYRLQPSCQSLRGVLVNSMLYCYIVKIKLWEDQQLHSNKSRPIKLQWQHENKIQPDTELYCTPFRLIICLGNGDFIAYDTPV